MLAALTDLWQSNSGDGLVFLIALMIMAASFTVGWLIVDDPS
jgi:hypothetical protein